MLLRFDGRSVRLQLQRDEQQRERRRRLLGASDIDSRNSGLDVVGPLYATKTEFGQRFREIVASEGVPAAVKWRAAQFRE